MLKYHKEIDIEDKTGSSQNIDTLGEIVNPCLLLVCFDDAMHHL